MNLDEAFSVFCIDNIAEENIASIKKKYKKLMLKYHPDNLSGNDEKAKYVSCAFDIIKQELKKISSLKAIENAGKQSIYNIVITLDKLIKLYDKDVLHMNINGKDTEVTIKDIQRNNAIIISEVSIFYKGLEYKYSSSQHWDITDRYKVNCELYVDNINEDTNIIVDVHGNKREINLRFNKTTIPIKIDNRVTVDVTVIKKMLSDKK